MNTFSDLPRFSPSARRPALAALVVKCLWWIVFFPVMFGLLLFAASQHERH